MRYGLNGLSQNVYLLKYTRPRYFHILKDLGFTDISRCTYKLAPIGGP